jgi:hypothetical protein
MWLHSEIMGSGTCFYKHLIIMTPSFSVLEAENGILLSLYIPLDILLIIEKQSKYMSVFWVAFSASSYLDVL